MTRYGGCENRSQNEGGGKRITKILEIDRDQSLVYGKRDNANGGDEEFLRQGGYGE